MTNPQVVDFAGVLDRATTLFGVVLECLSETFLNEKANADEVVLSQAAAIKAVEALVTRDMAAYEVDIATAVAQRLKESMNEEPPKPVEAKEDAIEVVDQTKGSRGVTFSTRVFGILRSQLLPLINHAAKAAPDDEHVRLAYAIACMAVADHCLDAYSDKIRESAPNLAKAFKAQLKEKYSEENS